MAGCCWLLFLVPQFFKLLFQKKYKNISFLFFFFLSIGCLVNFSYGLCLLFFNGSWDVIFSVVVDGFCSLLAFCVLFLIGVNNKKNKKKN
jgi:uncharacterized protein with PQ loop repeat